MLAFMVQIGYNRHSVPRKRTGYSVCEREERELGVLWDLETVPKNDTRS
jgi:hypothetical protein